MRKFWIVLIALFLIVTFIPTAYTDQAVETAKGKLKKVRRAYVLAKEELSEAQIDALFTIGKAEKQEAVKRVRDVRGEVGAAKKAYKNALNELHKAEITRDAKIDRSPWR